MDMRYPAEAEEFRKSVRAFLGVNLPPSWHGLGAIEDRGEADEFVEAWRKTLYANGYLGITWPREYGGAGLTKLEQVVLAEECARAGVPTGGYSDIFGVKMLGSTLLRWGTEDQKRRFLPRILSGEDVWCQGYSEPQAGSDLAGIRTRAAHIAADAEWSVTGQKIWTSRAHEANWMFLLARSEEGAEGHRGLSFLLLPMDQAGVDVRPIAMMSGEREFNEVFLDDARTPLENVVGEVGAGWKVAMALLGHERGEEAATNPVLFRAELDRLVAMARASGRLDDPVIRDRLSSLHVRCEIMRYLGYVTLTDVLAGRTASPAASSIAKLYWSEYHKDVAATALDVLGADALVVDGRVPVRPYRTDDPGAPARSGSWIGTFYNATCGTIYAGTSEVQRNILAETVLGLPR
jgi:alkylation response protein AidB-like acyl-CoA dehydrogenase